MADHQVVFPSQEQIRYECSEEGVASTKVVTTAADSVNFEIIGDTLYYGNFHPEKLQSGTIVQYGVRPIWMAAIIPPPRRHVTVYSGVLASNSKWRRWVIPKPLVMGSGDVVGKGEAESRGNSGSSGSDDRPSAANHLQTESHAKARSKSRIHYIP